MHDNMRLTIEVTELRALCQGLASEVRDLRNQLTFRANGGADPNDQRVFAKSDTGNVVLTRTKTDRKRLVDEFGRVWSEQIDGTFRGVTNPGMVALRAPDSRREYPAYDDLPASSVTRRVG